LRTLASRLPPAVRRWLPAIPPPTARNLWLATASLVISHNLWVIHATQRSNQLLVFVLVCWWGALTCMEDQFEELRPSPSRPGMVAGLVLLAWCLLRSGLIVDQDGLVQILPLLETLALALLCVPIRRLGHFHQQFLVMSLIPLRLVADRLLPELQISLMTARLTHFWLSTLGMPVIREQRVISFGESAVSVEGPCNGLDQIIFLMAIALIFLLAFPLRSWKHRLLILFSAPFIAFVGNSLRISLLALFNLMGGNNGRWWFDFFHTQEGSLIFAAISSSLLGWFYLKLIDRELGPPPAADA
jgi:cyanoexosortase A